MTRAVLLAAMLAGCNAIPMSWPQATIPQIQFVQFGVACLERSDMIARLTITFNEQPIAWGVTSTGAAIEFWRSLAGSWTLLINTGRQSCIAASGTTSEVNGGRAI